MTKIWRNRFFRHVQMKGATTKLFFSFFFSFWHRNKSYIKRLKYKTVNRLFNISVNILNWKLGEDNHLNFGLTTSARFKAVIKFSDWSDLYNLENMSVLSVKSAESQTSVFSDFVWRKYQWMMNIQMNNKWWPTPIALLSAKEEEQTNGADCTVTTTPNIVTFITVTLTYGQCAGLTVYITGPEFVTRSFWRGCQFSGYSYFRNSYIPCKKLCVYLVKSI